MRKVYQRFNDNYLGRMSGPVDEQLFRRASIKRLIERAQVKHRGVHKINISRIEKSRARNCAVDAAKWHRRVSPLVNVHD